MHPLRCPFCNMLLDNFSERGKGKHISACETKRWRYRHTGNPVGRPSTHSPIKSPGGEGSGDP